MRARARAALIIGSVKKELHPIHDHVACDVCGRTILKGERTETFVAPDGRRHEVCDLCYSRAEAHGWIRASTAGDLPARPARPEPRRSLFGFGRKRRPESAHEPAEREIEEGHGSANGAEPPEYDTSEEQAAAQPAPDRQRPRTRPKDPRHVRALPGTPEARVERALELFNATEHQRTVAGLARTLGPAWVAAIPDAAAPSTVDVVVAWELSWYRFRVDLGDARDPVTLVENGEELDQIDENLREWNATVDAEGRLVEGHALAGGGSGDG
jgi:hypothetical protein